MARAVQESIKPVSKWFITRYTLAMTGVWAALMTPVVVGLSVKLIGFDEAGAANNLSLVTTIGALLALLSNPFFGRLSDRTTSRFGRRRPWIIAGTLLALVGLLVIALSTNVVGVLVGWCIVQIAFNGALAPLTAILADQVPVKQRGLMSGFMGLANGLGILLGVGLADLFKNSSLWIFMGPGLIGVALIYLFVFTIKDKRLTGKPTETYNWKAFLNSFWVNPFKAPAYGWAWISCFLVFIGMAMVITYQALFLIHRFGFSAQEVPDKVLIGTAVATIVLMVSAVIGGILSDKFGRRKLFIYVASLLSIGALLMIAGVQSFGMFLLAAGVVGVAQGIYTAVDLAMVTEILPDKKDTAKDLGVLNIATTLPQSIAPAIAPLFLGIAGPNNFTALFIGVAVIAGIGTLTVIPIRGVR